MSPELLEGSGGRGPECLRSRYYGAVFKTVLRTLSILPCLSYFQIFVHVCLISKYYVHVCLILHIKSAYISGNIAKEKIQSERVVVLRCTNCRMSGGEPSGETKRKPRRERKAVKAANGERTRASMMTLLIALMMLKMCVPLYSAA